MTSGEGKFPRSLYRDQLSENELHYNRNKMSKMEIKSCDIP